MTTLVSAALTQIQDQRHGIVHCIMCFFTSFFCWHHIILLAIEVHEHIWLAQRCYMNCSGQKSNMRPVNCKSDILTTALLHYTNRHRINVLPLILAALAGPVTPAPYCCGPMMPADTCRWRSNVDGSSLRRSDMFLLNGDESASRVNPRNEPCRSSMSAEACGRWTAYGFSTFLTGTGSEIYQTQHQQLAMGAPILLSWGCTLILLWSTGMHADTLIDLLY